MAVSRAEILERQLTQRLEQWLAAAPPPALAGSQPIRPGARLAATEACTLLEAMYLSRALDLEARRLKHRDAGYYTIGSSGHEGNAVLGLLLRTTDPCFLHYRAGAWMMARMRKGGADAIYDSMLSFVAAAEDPSAGGRHKVWGSRELWVPPQTSTIASHLPKAMGMAFALERAGRLGLPVEIPADSIVACSFGDASVNHNVAQSGLNTAGWLTHQRQPVPVLFVCEDNGIGISVPSPHGWVEAMLRSRPGIRYFSGDGLDLADAYRASADAIQFVRSQRKPAILHLRTVRLLGHAGSDVETEYHSLAEIEATERRDPLLAASDLLIGSGALSAVAAMDLWNSLRQRVREAADLCVRKRKLESLAEVVAPLAPYTPDAVEAVASSCAEPAARAAAFGGEDKLPERAPRPRPLATLLNAGLTDAMAQHPDILLFGEDVAKKGGVYHVTADLFDRFGPGRVFNTLLDETSILGIALGAGHLGLLPMPEIQYLAYLHNAEDQLRSEALSLQYFSNGKFRNPAVVRIAAFGYQKGFGGHFHNDNAIGVLRDIPGIVIAAPSRGDDAVEMLRTAIALAKVDGRVVAFLEPIALYHEKDLYAPGDGGWCFRYPEPGRFAALGRGRLYVAGQGLPDDGGDRDLLIVSYANGLRLSLIAAQRLRQRGIGARVLDLRWLAPLPLDEVREQARICGRVLVVDECRHTGGGVAEALLASLSESEETRSIPAARITGADTYIPLGPAANYCLPSVDSIEAAAVSLLQRSCPASTPSAATA
ncbi:MAG: MFS transporter [Planctomycetes bacterium]|nr:MFS transporter [Planctomycetota bacterium]